MRLRPDLEIFPLRGNVDTRLAKLDRGDADAIFLAAAGLNRLGLGHLPRAWLDPVETPPAPGQGILAIQTRLADQTAPWLAPFRHTPTQIVAAAERGALTALEASCKTAVGAYAQIVDGEIRLVVEALTADGARTFRETGAIGAEGSDPETRARALGLALGHAVRTRGGAALLTSP